ncbi:MAG: fatty acid desaturase [Woeseiaceae bacterium]|nr:fatty acid desaturase [Woeseiaceae bacterium]
MTDFDTLDKRALASARPYMGVVAWPTVMLGLVTVLSYLATVALALTGVLSLWLAVPIVSVLTYVSYTVAHESVHGSITGNHRSLRWMNKALGYMSAWILMIPLTAHRHEHMAHHRHANDPAGDPDFPVAKMQNSLSGAARAALEITAGQFRYYFTHRWEKAPLKEKLALCVEVAAALIPRMSVLAAGYWVEGLALFVLAWLIGIVVLLYLFAYIVHRPHDQTERYLDTSTIVLPGPVGTLLTWLWLFQNYHSIHHLFPRLPFYQYAKLYNEIEEIMAAKGAPVYRVTLRGLQPSSPRLAA